MADPVSNSSDGYVKILWTPTCPIPTAPDLSADIGAAGAVDLTSYFTGDGFTPSYDETVVNDPRLSTRQAFERPGRNAISLTVKYVYRAQDSGDADNKAFDTLIEATAGFLIVRFGLPFETAFLAAQIVDVVPVTCGIQQKLPPEENSILVMQQRMFVTNVVARNVAVVA